MTGLREGLTWFDAHLKARPDRREGPCANAAKDARKTEHSDQRADQKPVRIYVMGAEEWRELDDFPPPARQTRYYLQPRQAGDRAAATESPPDRYRYDPADPTPALGGALLAFQGAGPQDNRPLEARSDVLCYTTAPLEQGLEVIGPVRLELYARSSLAPYRFLWPAVRRRPRWALDQHL